MHNTLEDLNNFMFGQLERLDNPDLSDEELQKEKGRSKAMVDIGKTIVDNARLSLEARKFAAELEIQGRSEAMPAMLETHGEKD